MLGRVVSSRAGRDRGDRYVVVETLGDDMVLVADGEKRGIGRPKRKNVKHLILHDVAPDLAAKLRHGQALRDEEIRLALASSASATEEPGTPDASDGPAGAGD